MGSYLNVLALRTLNDESVFWPPSHCSHCQKQLYIWDNIPVISYLLLKGKCRHCQKSISFQYPLVEILTALMFFVFYQQFQFSWFGLGMLFFGCTLITICITDFREKLIPHDITYPAMLVGLCFSALVRHDFIGAMVGVGASYILFDFLAHYGLKLYLRYHQLPLNETSEEEDDDLQVDKDLSLSGSAQPAEDLEVLGGGDAVLAAVISAWLGWERLIVAVAVGFILGTIMGLVLLLKELHSARMLRNCLRPAIAGFVLGFALLGLPGIVLGSLSATPLNQFPWLTLALCGAGAGSLLGVVSVGSAVSKPFPFGPALAAGAFLAIFWNPIGALLSGGA